MLFLESLSDSYMEHCIDAYIRVNLFSWVNEMERDIDAFLEKWQSGDSRQALLMIGEINDSGLPQC